MTVATWLDDHADRVLARQRGQADAAKLLATFACAVAAALVGVAFQMDGDSSRASTLASLIALLTSFFLALAVALADTMRELDHERLLTESVVRGQDEAEQLTSLRANSLAAVMLNEEVIRRIRLLLALQLAAALVASLLSSFSLWTVT